MLHEGEKRSSCVLLVDPYDKGMNKKYLDTFLLLTSDPDFQSELAKLREEISIPDEAFDDEVDQTKQDSLVSEWYKNVTEPQIEKLSAFIRKVIHEFNLSKAFEMTLTQYVFTGKIYRTPAIPFSFRPNPKDRTVSVLIGQKLTNEDLKTIKEYVNGYFGNILPELKEVPGIEKRIVAEKLYREREEHDFVENKTTRRSAKEITQNILEETGESMSRDELYDVPRQLERLRKERFKKSGND